MSGLAARLCLVCRTSSVAEAMKIENAMPIRTIAASAGVFPIARPPRLLIRLRKDRIMERPPPVAPPRAFLLAFAFRSDPFQASAEGGLRPLLFWSSLFSAPSDRYIDRYRSGDC